MVVLQAESEVAAINMVYGGAGSGKKVMTSSSSPGVSLKMCIRDRHTVCQKRSHNSIVALPNFLPLDAL